MIHRNIIPYLDFVTVIDTINKKYILENKKEDEKRIILFKFSIVPTNEFQDFKWPVSVTVTRNNNYVYSIQGVTDKNQEFRPWIDIDASKENWSITFDNYDTNTNIVLTGVVEEPEGRNIEG